MAMSDYIKREDAIEAIEDTDWYHINSQAEMVHGANSELHQAWYKAIDIYSAIDSVPSADVAPVVRCKDCKWQDKGKNDSESWNICMYRPWSYKPIEDTDFCSDGKRRNDE